MTLSEAERQYKASRIKIPKCLNQLLEIPIWKEQGISVVYQHWKEIMSTKNMTRRGSPIEMMLLEEWLTLILGRGI